MPKRKTSGGKKTRLKGGLTTATVQGGTADQV